MKSFKLTAITAAVLSASAATSAFASLDQFIGDSSFDIKLRNVYHSNDAKNRPDIGGGFGTSDTEGGGLDWHDYAQAIELNFSSGYLLGMFGADFSSYSALKLDSSSSNPNTNGKPGNLLQGKSDGDMTSYSKVGQAFVKFKLGDENLGMHAKYGLMTLDTMFIASSVSRSTPSSFRGSEVTGSLFGIDLYGVYADQISKRTEESYDDLKSLNGKNIDFMAAVGFKTNIIGMDFEGEYAESEGYMKQGYLGASYDLVFTDSMSLLLDGQFYKAQKNGDLWSWGVDADGNPQKQNGFKNDAQLQNLNAVFSVAGLDLGLSYSDVQAEGGWYDYDMSAEDYGNANFWTSRQVSDFWFDGEQVLQASALYNFADVGLPGLFFGMTYTHGSNINVNGINAERGAGSIKFNAEREIDTFVGYEFTGGALEGLRLKALNGYWKGLADAQFTDQKDARESNVRLYADYTISVF